MNRISSMRGLVRHVREMPSSLRLRAALRPQRDAISAGQGRDLLTDWGIDPRSADRMAGKLARVSTLPAPEALCYTVAALCVLQHNAPAMAKFLPAAAQWEIVRVALSRLTGDESGRDDADIR